MDRQGRATSRSSTCHISNYLALCCLVPLLMATNFEPLLSMAYSYILWLTQKGLLGFGKALSRWTNTPLWASALCRNKRRPDRIRPGLP